MKKLIYLFVLCLSITAFAQEEALEKPFIEEVFPENQPQTHMDRSPDSEEPYPDADPDPRLEEPQYQEPVEQNYDEQY